MNVKTDQGPVIQPSGQFLHTKQRDDQMIILGINHILGSSQ